MAARQLWFRSRAAWAFIALRYVPALAILNTGWEIAQLPLYTLWEEGSLPSIAYAVLHCTLGDVAIGTLALVFALIASRARAVETWRWRQVALFLVIPAVVYTVFSEWMNTVARAGWEYSALMPVVRFLGLEIGLSPLLQWVIIPPVALRLAWPEASRGLRAAPFSPGCSPCQGGNNEEISVQHVKSRKNQCHTAEDLE